MNEISAAGTVEKDHEIVGLCQKALSKLDTALDLHPPRLLDEVDVAENAVARLRDVLIGRHRKAQSPADGAEVKRVLDRVNTALSLIAGVIYPSGGIQRSCIEEARNLLRDAAGPCEHVPTEALHDETAFP
ncbi:MAG: hypothetical protein AB1558_05385 [Thermodesulfobacteriota bacterium]|jgi:hypothetical protein